MRWLSDLLLVTENWLIILGVLALLAYRKKISWLFFCTIVLSALWLIIIGLSPIPYKLAEQLENKYPTCNFLADTGVTYIVVLGSGKSSDPDLNYLNQLYNTQLSRLIEGFRLYKQSSTATLISSGNKASSIISQAKVVAEAALMLGVDKEDTLMLPNTFSTESEALELRKRLPDLKRVVLVTSALHMKRAKTWFEAYGFEVIPAPTDHQVKVDPQANDSFWGWNTSKITLTNKIIHEYFGQLYANYSIRKIND